MPTCLFLPNPPGRMELEFFLLIKDSHLVLFYWLDQRLTFLRSLKMSAEHDACIYYEQFLMQRIAFCVENELFITII